MEPPEAELAWAGAEEAGSEGVRVAGAGGSEAAISGVVTRSDGAVAAGVSVTALNSANAVAGTTVTGADGRYLLRVPGPGDYVVIAAGQRSREVPLDASAERDAPVLLRIGERP
jgi:hypothetical protein